MFIHSYAEHVIMLGAVDPKPMDVQLAVPIEWEVPNERI